MQTGAKATKRAGPATAHTAATAGASAAQGWTARNCTLTDHDGVLELRAEGGRRAANAFITRSGLSLPGPVTLTLRLRTAQAGRLGLAWRTDAQPDFTPENRKFVEYAATADWQTITLTTPATGKVIHVRVQFPSADAIDLRQIELHGAGAASH